MLIKTKYSSLIWGLVVLPISLSINAAGTSKEASIQQIVDTSQSSARVPVWIALGVADVGSNFDQSWVSPNGAVGIMQITPTVAASKLGINPDDLADQGVNILAGVRYLDELHRLYDGRWELVLSHYQGGELSRDAGVPIPHGFNREYVKQVLDAALDYQIDGYPEPTVSEAQSPRFTGYEQLKLTPVKQPSQSGWQLTDYIQATTGSETRGVSVCGCETERDYQNWIDGEYQYRGGDFVTYSNQLLPPAEVGSHMYHWYSNLRRTFRDELANRRSAWLTGPRVPITE